LGVLGGPGAVLVKPWGVTWALLGESWVCLGGPGGVLGRACGRPSAPDVTHTDVSASPMLSMLFYYFFDFLISYSFFFVFVVALGGPELLLGSFVGPQGMLEGFLDSLGGPRRFLGGSRRSSEVP